MKFSRIVRGALFASAAAIMAVSGVAQDASAE